MPLPPLVVPQRKIFGRDFTLVESDCVAWLQTLNDESVACTITDPAYESLEKHRAIGTTTRLKHSKASSNDWFTIFPNARFEELLAQLYRVQARDSHLYLFCDQETMFVVKPIAEQVGFKFWKALVWVKDRIGMGYHYRAKHELILFFEKGKRKLRDLGIADVLPFPAIRGGYPAEKPVPLLDVLVAQSTKEDELVMDPFMGSGSTGVAALRRGRRFIGCDVAPEALTVARNRLEPHPMLLERIGEGEVR